MLRGSAGGIWGKGLRLMVRTIAVVWVCFVGLASWGGAFQRIRALSVTELVGESELVVVAEVAGVVSLGAEGNLVRVKTS